MKKRNIIFIILGVIVFLIIFSIIIYYIRNKSVDNRDLINSRNKMLSELKNFSYNGDVEVKVLGNSFNVNIDCKEDRKNELGYCYVTSKLVNIEEYMDYKNKTTYTKTITSYETSDWKKNIESKMTQVTPFLSMIEKMDIRSKKKVENGTIYEGYINGNNAKGIMNTASKTIPVKINVSKLFSKKVPVTVFVNDKNYIENMNIAISIVGIKVNMNINYHDFNNTSSLSLPGGFNEFQY